MCSLVSSLAYYLKIKGSRGRSTAFLFRNRTPTRRTLKARLFVRYQSSARPMQIQYSGRQAGGRVALAANKAAIGTPTNARASDEGFQSTRDHPNAESGAAAGAVPSCDQAAHARAAFVGETQPPEPSTPHVVPLYTSSTRCRCRPRASQSAMDRVSCWRVVQNGAPKFRSDDVHRSDLPVHPQPTVS